MTKDPRARRRCPTVLLLLCAPICLTPACSADEHSIPLSEGVSSHSLVNLQHFDHLFTEIEVGDKRMGVVNIYSEYPDYAYAIEPEEGFACVDDAARAIVMLSEYLQLAQDDDVLLKAKKLVEFVLYMQNANGYFNNFIWEDGSINTSYRTSLAEMNWWSFRALWALEVAHELVLSDRELANQIDAATKKVVANIKRDISLGGFRTEVVHTIEIATWLPHKYAADQAAVAIIALLPHYSRTGDGQVLEVINALASGIMQMQKGDADNYPYGMFLSWKNQWHSWGNSQAYALLLAGEQLGQPEYTQSALTEIDNFYPYLLNNGFSESILIKRESGGFSEIRKVRFPQIPYGVRPMVYAASEAFRVTGDKRYLALSTRLGSWFFGQNDAAKIIYDNDNGRTYDGIISATEINMNSGAESTIEGLLVMLGL
jgi:hypothetical protein